MGWVARDLAGGLCAKLLLIWSGISIGVALLATPAKFRAASLSLPVALDVGRETFRVYNTVELGLAAAAVGLALGSPARARWLAWLAVPLAVIAVEAAWLLPALQARTALVQAGLTPPPSPLHALYIGGEILKIGVLILAGVSFDPARMGFAPGRARESSWIRLRPRLRS
jgi:hypothetical protein